MNMRFFARGFDTKLGEEMAKMQAKASEAEVQGLTGVGCRGRIM